MERHSSSSGRNLTPLLTDLKNLLRKARRGRRRVPNDDEI